VIDGTLVGLDEKTPVEGAVVFAYHTDRSGLYDHPSAPPHSWRLQGAVRTDANGRFRFTTIRPAPYPGRAIPAHVHLEFQTANGRYHGGEIRFADDPLVDGAERTASERAGRFAWVLRSTPVEGVQQVHLNARLVPDQRY
jgi:protocatechuate 3,4-dioxygenase beta subunit